MLSKVTSSRRRTGGSPEGGKEGNESVRTEAGSRKRPNNMTWFTPSFWK